MDELFRLLNMYHDVQPGELIRELKSFPIWVKATGIEQGKSNNITTENYLKIEPQIEVGNVILMSIVDYDYVLKRICCQAIYRLYFLEIKIVTGKTEVWKK